MYPLKKNFSASLRSMHHSIIKLDHLILYQDPLKENFSASQFLSEPPLVHTQSRAVNASLNQAVSSNNIQGSSLNYTQGSVDWVIMNDRLTKRIKIMQATIQDCLGSMRI